MAHTHADIPVLVQRREKACTEYAPSPMQMATLILLEAVAITSRFRQERKRGDLLLRLLVRPPDWSSANPHLESTAPKKVVRPG